MGGVGLGWGHRGGAVRVVDVGRGGVNLGEKLGMGRGVSSDGGCHNEGAVYVVSGI